MARSVLSLRVRARRSFPVNRELLDGVAERVSEFLRSPGEARDAALTLLDVLPASDGDGFLVDRIDRLDELHDLWSEGVRVQAISDEAYDPRQWSDWETELLLSVELEVEGLTDAGLSEALARGMEWQLAGVARERVTWLSGAYIEGVDVAFAPEGDAPAPR